MSIYNDIRSVDDARRAVADIAVELDRLNNEQYFLTSETDTGRTWIDGKPIYRKVLDTGAVPNGAGAGGAYTDTAHGVSDLGTIVRLYGMALEPGTPAEIPLPLATFDPSTTTSARAIAIYRQGANIRILTNYNASAFTSSFVVMEYTKA